MGRFRIYYSTLKKYFLEWQVVAGLGFPVMVVRALVLRLAHSDDAVNMLCRLRFQRVA